MISGQYNPMFMSSNTLLTFSLINTGTSSTESISIPASAAVGDFAILYQFAAAGADPSFGTPSGWTVNKLVNTVGANGGGQICSRILTSASGTVSTGTTVSGGGEIATGIKIFRPSRPLNTIVPSATWNGATSLGDPTLQTTNPSAETTAVIVVALGAAFSSTFTFSTASPAFDSILTNDTGSAYSNFAHTVYNISPLSQSVDMNDEGSRNTLISGYYTFT